MLRLNRTSPCQECRARKRRCFHQSKVSSPVKQHAKDSTPAGTAFAPDEAGTRETTPGTSRVSAYIPQTVLEELSSTSPDVRPTFDSVTLGAGHVERLHRWWKRNRTQDRPPFLSEPYRRYLEDAGAFVVLPQSTTDALLPIYNTLIDELVPIIHGARLLRTYSNGKASTYLVRAVCLVAAKANQAAPFLRLAQDDQILNCAQFTENLRNGLEAALQADLEPDRVIRIQILALLHLHNDGFGGPERASKSLSNAISEAWAISIHFPIPGDPDMEQYALLWWSLRNLDRLNKPVMGCAPFMIDDTDTNLDRVQLRPNDYRSELMNVSTRLGDLMAYATKAYKASYKGTADVEGPFPSFADIAADASLDTFHRAHRDYLEVWYHVTSMLSCRFGDSTTVQYERRLCSADRVIDLLADGKFERLPPLPLVPYAMALATTNVFRAFRDGRRDGPSTQRHIDVCRTTLLAMRGKWTSAKGMTRPVARAYRNIEESPASQQQTAFLGTWRPLEQPHAGGDRSGQWYASNMDPLPEDWSLLFDDRYLQGEGTQDFTRFYELFSDIDNWQSLTDEAPRAI